LLADGVATHIGSGCTGPKHFSLTVGTTGAVRAVIETPPGRIQPGLWRYRADRSNSILGGALSNGGEILAWLKRTLQLPRDLEARLDQAIPGTHGLGVLPFLAGERTPYWRGDLRGAITGLSYSTESFDILRAALESTTLGFRQVYELLVTSLGPPGEVIVSGGALLRSAGWTQMIADALGTPVTPSTILEAASRGAAMWALTQTGTIPSLASISTSMGATFEPRPAAQAVFDRLAEDRAKLFERLYGPSN
jgi:gluconokinase